MDLLAKNMDSITSFSEQISYTLHDTRQEIAKLSSVHALLKKLQFLFKLPGNLKDKMNEENYTQVYIPFHSINTRTIYSSLQILVYEEILLILLGSTRLYSRAACVKSVWQ